MTKKKRDYIETLKIVKITNTISLTCTMLIATGYLNRYVSEKQTNKNKKDILGVH